ncbi:MAG: ABC transporter ATP-binding protein [Erysipelotrichaceae bacterium]|nr:ABC transporter ATP-binding protein [Erysipelotrichaceae bacterium]
MENIITIRQLTKHYPNFTLEDINLMIPKGSIMGLIGENGAGKTTLIKLILNIVKADQGQILVFDQDNIQAEKMIKERIGIVLDDAFFADTLKIREVVKIVSRLYKTWDEALFQHYLELFSLPDNQVIKTFSRGMKKKLEIAVALAHRPQLLILDEPTSGLDPVVRSEILDILREFIQNEENGILISSHITSDLEHIADYITFINHGQLVFTKSHDELSDDFGIIKCGRQQFEQLDSEDYINYKQYAYNYEVLVGDRQAVRRKYADLTIDKPSIEEIMLLYIKGAK